MSFVGLGFIHENTGAEYTSNLTATVTTEQNINATIVSENQLNGVVDT